ncbi:uncharacterized protein At1g15400-like [Phalaenopsis equestris]|uniref:uncharacterized protein At1g15400-like n=1 Tax=Phalaenopsis equestris TaxID=78828 RepID=UPI0009E3529E|nr:uncharacterized protein At1g15400-like [Phalaenopsis equestris]
MAGLQRSSETFRRSGSSGLVWEDRHLPGEMNSNTSKPKDDFDADPISLRPTQSVGAIGMMRRSRSTGGGTGGGAKAYRADQVTPAVDPPSPKVSCCGAFCGDFGKSGSNQKRKPRRR